MKKNNRGFVLAEAIVVAVFVLGMFTYLAMNIFPLITKYDKAIDYNDPNETYLANVLYEEMKMAPDINNIDDIKGVYSFSSDAGTGAIVCLKNGVTCDKILSEDYYKKLIYNHIKAKELIIYKATADVTSWKNNMSRGIREYFNYSENIYTDDSTLKILIEFQNGKYASVEA